MESARSGDQGNGPGTAGALGGDEGLVVSIDADCALCRDLASWAAARAEVPVAVTVAEEGSEAVVVFRGGERREGAAGVVLLGSVLGGRAARVARWLERPGVRQLAAGGYRRFARHHRKAARLWVRFRLGRFLGAGHDA